MPDDDIKAGTLRIGGNVTLRRTEGDTTHEWKTRNTITAAGLEIICDYLASADPGYAQTPPSFFAVGSGQLFADNIANLEVLPGEIHRSPIVARDTAGQACVYHGFLDATDALTLTLSGQTIRCYGLIAGTDATDDPQTGVLFAIAPEEIPFTKTIGMTISMDWQIMASGEFA